MNSRRLTNLGLVPLFVLVAACSSDADDAAAGSESEITAGQIVAGSSPYYWADVPYEDHARGMASAGFALDANLASDADPLRLRLQAWADRFDVALRRTTGNEVAPRPIVKLLKSSHTYNAWSSGTIARLGVPFGAVLPAGQAPSLAMIGFTRPDILDGEDWSSFSGSHPAAWTRPQSFTQVWNLANGPCKLSSAGGRIVANEACDLAAVSASDVGTYATTPFITFSTDLASILDEDAIAFVMAHELGHLYRAHSSPLTARKYSFWYDDGPAVPKRPVPSVESTELTSIYARVARQASPVDHVEGARLQVRSRLPVVTLGYLGAFQGCATLTAWSGQRSIEALLSQALASAQITSSFAADYLSYESAVQACPGGATFHDESQSPLAAGQLPLGSMTSQLRTFAYAPESALPRASETVAAYIARLEAAASSLAAEEAGFLQRVKEKGLGLYTTEQEADEVALELLARVGVSPRAGILGWLAFMAAMEKLDGAAPSGESGEASSSQCGAWLNDGFMTTDPSGAKQRVRITLGALADTHHGSCYRVYNLWREAEAHRFGSYVKVAASEPFSPSWPELAAHAAALTQEAASQGR